ncbi:hypothetical protein L0222_22175 [bacterium]|nr:hypothetical protein [bacterium]MCI0601966.1 hypothetical protein [bacterium]
MKLHRGFLSIIFILVILFASCKKKEAPSTAQMRNPIYDSPVLQVPAAQMREEFLKAYRLKPDRRALMALAEIDYLITGKNKKPTEARFVQGRWKILYDDKKVAEIPEFPDFKDLLKILQKQAEALVAKYEHTEARSVPKPQAAFLVPQAIESLRNTNQKWKRKTLDVQTLSEASRSLTALTLQSLDRLEIADIVSARALAATVLTQKLSGDPMIREECLLAHSMGYSKHANELALKLPENDPVRLFFEQKDDQLLKTASTPASTDQTRYLSMMRISLKRDSGAWNKLSTTLFKNRDSALSLLKTGLDVRQFEMAGLSHYIQPLVFLQITKNKVTSKELSSLRQADSTRKFETELSEYAKAQSGPFWDAEISTAFFRAFFYSSLDIVGRHYLDSLASKEAVSEFSRQLGNSASPIEEQFHLWYTKLAESDQGKSNERAIVANFWKLSELGAPPLMRWFALLMDRLSVWHRDFSLVTRECVSRFDSRISHRMFLQDVAYQRLGDLKLAETLCKSVVRVSVEESVETMRCAHFIGNDDLVLKALMSTKKDFSSRSIALFYLKRDFQNRDVVQKAFENAIRLDPESWNLRNQYADFLSDADALNEACTTIEDWLKHYEDTSSGFDAIQARTLLARVYGRMGQYQKGWSTIEPVVSSWQGGALMEAADYWII